MAILNKDELECCGVRIRRENASRDKKTGQILVGHQWIELVDQHGVIKFSAGFWPTGNIWMSRGFVDIPDEKEGKTAGINSRPINKKEACEDTCDKITLCVRSSAALAKINPPGYRLLWFNCRNWTKRILNHCGLVI
jgi:hypothetical protein